MENINPIFDPFEKPQLPKLPLKDESGRDLQIHFIVTRPVMIQFQMEGIYTALAYEKQVAMNNIKLILPQGSFATYLGARSMKEIVELVKTNAADMPMETTFTPPQETPVEKPTFEQFVNRLELAAHEFCPAEEKDNLFRIIRLLKNNKVEQGENTNLKG